MASGNQPEKTVEDAMKNLKINPPSKISNANMTGPKDGSPSDATSCISGDATSSIRGSEVDQEALMVDQGMYYPANGYYGYYYPGFDGSFGEWDDQSYYLGTDALEIQHPAIQSDNGSLVYYLPGFQPGYTPCSPFSPGAMVGVDGQYLGQQPYIPNSMYPQPLVSSGYFPQSIGYGPELMPTYQWDSSPMFMEGHHGNGFGVDPTVPASPKPNVSSQGHRLAYSKASPHSKSTTYVELKGSSPIPDVSPKPGVPNQSVKPGNKAAAVLSKGYLPINKFPSYPNQGKGGLYPNSPTNFKENGRSWVGTEKLKVRSKGQGVGNCDLLNEQNCGPRTNVAQTRVDPVGSLSTNGNDNTSNAVIRKDDYNLPDFPTKYEHASFFVIKSYSEDDIHKSIKYNVWASTPNGNKRLDNAFQVAQEKMMEKDTKCPIFLFFSVNASGQFCGVAEMIGRVDFSKNMDFWQQDKWNGFFPVKWHIIKDIPNPQFRHIILENNENKPVTNSRDTQEVKFPQGTEMLNIFKSYSSRTSILDDFGFYENRQKAMQDKRIKAPTTNLEHLLPKTDETAEITKPDGLNSIVSSLQSIELAAANSKEELPLGDATKV